MPSTSSRCMPTSAGSVSGPRVVTDSRSLGTRTRRSGSGRPGSGGGTGISGMGAATLLPSPSAEAQDGRRAASSVRAFSRFSADTRPILMAELIYSTICSLDGYVADEHGDFRWGQPDDEVHAFINELERP